MKVYFAGSIRGGRGDASLYAELVAHLATHVVVLTEHVADPESADEGRSDETIFARDVAWLTSCDAVVAEVTTPSLGVGYELALAETLGKPVLCLFRPGAGHALSAMVAGNPLLELGEYDTFPVAAAHIDGFLARVGE